MISSVCIDAANKQGKLGHKDCRGWFKEMVKSGMTGTEGQDLVSFGSKTYCRCQCHLRHEREY